MISKEQTKNVLDKYLRIRLVETRIAQEYRHGEIRCPTHLSLGQELLPSILGALFRPSDLAISSHRGHAHYISKGGSIYALIAELYGKVSGCSRGRGGSMHLVDLSVNFLGTTAIVANSIPVGVGSAAFLKMREDRGEDLCFVFFGDGAVEEGVFSESLNLAALKELPVVFVCENNAYSVYTHLQERQPNMRKIFEWASAFGVRSEFIDVTSSEIQEVFEKTSSLLDWARKYRKPLLIEVPTWREIEHCGPNNDDHLNYRSVLEINRWKGINQEKKIREFARKIGISDEESHEIRNQILAEIDESFAKAKIDPFENATAAEMAIYA